jgi:hypothetical protein
VLPIRYGFLDLFSFLLPGPTRTAPVSRILREIRTARVAYPGAHISIIAHSFGTYAVARILRDEGDVVLHRLLLCGSIVPASFRWDLVRGRLADKPINDCGDADVWPLVAKSVTWGYGASGVLGFGSVVVTDRFHPFAHSQYFDAAFVREYWRPYVLEGTVRESSYENRRPSLSYWRQLLSKLPLQWILLASLALSVALAAGRYLDAKGDGSSTRDRSSAIAAAWQVVRSTEGRAGDLGRKAALEVLVSAGEDLANLRLDSAYLPRARFAGGRFNGTSFRGADLGGAVLDSAQLGSADFSGAQLGQATLRCADIYHAKFIGAQMGASTLDSAFGNEVDFTGAWLRNASAIGAWIPRSRFGAGRLESAQFVGAVLQEADLHASWLQDASFENADLTLAKMPAPDLGIPSAPWQYRWIKLRGAHVAGASPREFRLAAVNELGGSADTLPGPPYPSGRCEKRPASARVRPNER